VRYAERRIVLSVLFVVPLIEIVPLSWNQNRSPDFGA
jgi:hypothetical protein